MVPGDVDQRSERGVDGCGILEDFGDVGFQQHYIRPLAIRFVVLATDAVCKIVFRTHHALFIVLTHLASTLRLARHISGRRECLPGANVDSLSECLLR